MLVIVILFNVESLQLPLSNPIPLLPMALMRVKHAGQNREQPQMSAGQSPFDFV
jgi:hypothetical protein